MQSCGIVGSEKLDFEKSVGSRSLEGSSIWGRLGLEGLFDNRVLQLIH